MMSEIVIAVCSLLGTAIGSFGGMRLMSYRIEQLEKKVDKLEENDTTRIEQLERRVYRLEENDAVQSEQMKVTNKRITDLERKRES